MLFVICISQKGFTLSTDATHDLKPLNQMSNNQNSLNREKEETSERTSRTEEGFLKSSSQDIQWVFIYS